MIMLEELIDILVESIFFSESVFELYMDKTLEVDSIDI